MTYRTRNIAIAVGLALVAMLLTLMYVVNYRHSVQTSQAMSKVYVATHDIPVGTSGGDLGHALKLISVPRHTVAPGAISSPTQVAGLVVSEPIYQGDQVTIRRFVTLRDEGIPGQLRGSMRAVQVPGDPNQLLAGTLQPGNRVDVVANLRNDPSAQAPTTRIVLRNIDVLQTAPDSSSVTSTDGTTTYVILAVSDTQVQRLFFVMTNDDWTLELRPAAGAKDDPDQPATPSSVLHGA